MMKKINVLAIDPGSTESGYVVWDGGSIVEMGIARNNYLKHRIACRNDFNNCEMAIEMVASYGMPVGATVFDTCVWIGRFIQAFETNNANRRQDLIYRKDVKMYLCNSMRAKDSNIRQAMIDRFEPTLEPKKRPKGILKGVSKDIWSALAIAVTYYDKNKDTIGTPIEIQFVHE